jgi:PAS domain S-box-containing protein
MPSNFPRTIICLTLVVFGFALSSKAETQQIIDSLVSRLETARGKEKLAAYSEIIKNYRNLDPEKGIEYARSALRLADSLQDLRSSGFIMNEQGVCFRKLNIYEEALRLHFDALRIFDQLNDSMGTAYTFANIGMVYFFFRDYQSALDYQYRSLLIKEYLKDEAQIAYSQNNIGMVLVELGDYARALDYYLSAMAIRKRLNNHFELANVYANIGKVFVKLSRFDDAETYFNLAKDIYQNENADYGHALVLNEMADLFVRRNKPQKALEYLEQAESIAHRINNLSILLYNYNLQSSIHAGLKDFANAYRYTRNSIAAKDSLFGEQRSREMAEIRVRYETKRIDSENEILRLKLSEQNLRLRYMVMIFIGVVLILSSFFMVLRFFRNRKINHKLARINEELEERVTERTSALKDEIQNKEIVVHSLAKSEERFRAISEASPMGIAVSDQKGLCVFTNAKLTHITGISGDHFIRGTWLKSVFIDDRRLLESIWLNGHEKRLEGFELDFRIRNEKNELRWMHLRAASMMINHQFVGMVSMIEDISERKHSEEELIKAKNKAEESDKLKSAFLANMSHEIRTPMNAILGFTDLLSSDEYELTEKTEFLEMIKFSGRLLLNLINDIIDISKIEAGELKIQPISFSPAALMNELQLTFRSQLDSQSKQEVKLLIEYPSGFDKVLMYTDKLRLQQVLTNLLSNAIKFTSQGQIVLGVIQFEDNFEFYVKDTGIGIPPGKLEVVFDRFRQADESHTRLYGGTGLGLAIVKNLITLLGGRIWVDSIEGKGTAFYFTLPIVQPPDQSIAKSEGVTYEKRVTPDFSGKTILIAEDIETNFHLIRTMLRNTNARLLHAPDGLIALDMAASDPLPDLILMDIQMPNMDGVESMKKIRLQGKPITIVAITAFALQGEGKYFTEIGFDAYLSKPLSQEKLIETIKIFLG